mgnify:FL=1
MLHNIIFSSNLFFLCIILGIAFTTFLYFAQRKSLKLSVLSFLSLARFILITFLSFLILDPVVKSINKITEDPIIVILQDSSNSIERNIKDNLDQLAKDIKGYEVYKYHFSDKLHSEFIGENKGLKTNFTKALSQIKSMFINQNLSSIVLASDGLNNSGLNPIYSDNLSVPIHTVCLGDTNIISDNLISNVKHNDIVFQGNSFLAEIYITSQKFKGDKLFLSIDNNGKTIFNDEIKITSNSQFLNIPVEISTSELGVQSYDVKISPIANEKNVKNNNFRFYVDVINSKYKILLVNDNSHPDVAAYVSVIGANKDYDLEVLKSNEIVNDLSLYNLIVLHSVSDESLISKIIDNYDIPVLIFCKQEFNTYSDLFPNVDFKKRSSNNEVLSHVNADFLNFKISQSTVNLINIFPPISTSFGIYNVGSNVDVFINEKVGNTISDSPICLFDEIDGQKTGVLFGEGFWRWKLRDYQINSNNDIFNELFNKITQHLLIREDKSKFRLFYDKEINENEELIFQAQVYNENYELDNKEDISLFLTNSNKKEFKFLFDRLDDKYFLDIGSLESDKYSLYAKVDKRNYEKYGQLTVRPIQIESLSTVADHQFLYNLSNITGGKSYSPLEFSSLTNYINTNQNKSSLTTIEDKLKQLIDFEWILLILLILISSEWFVRKYNGLT